MKELSRALLLFFAIGSAHAQTFEIKETVTLQQNRLFEAKTLKMAPGALIITGPYDVTFKVDTLEIGAGASIRAFVVPATAGQPGQNAGTVTIRAKSIKGAKLSVDLTGQAGGAGSIGARGGQGPAGSQGTQRDYNPLNGCIGGSNGTSGGPGYAGAPGGAGLRGGNGGSLYLIGAGAMPIDARLQGGPGGKGGAGGEGGPGGPGGQGAAGRTFCGGTGPGLTGPQGAPGQAGPDGATGNEGRLVDLTKLQGLEDLK